jgi:hypothetical protein
MEEPEKGEPDKRVKGKQFSSLIVPPLSSAVALSL